MKVIVLIMHFELSREEHLLSMRVEELAQLSCCVSFPRIVSETASLRVAKAKIVMFGQNCVPLDKGRTTAALIVDCFLLAPNNPAHGSNESPDPMHAKAGLHRPALHDR